MKDTAYEVEMTQDTEKKRYQIDGTPRDPSGDELELYHRGAHLAKLFLIVMLGVLPIILMLTVID